MSRDDRVFETLSPALVLEPFSDEERGFSGLVPTGWQELAPANLARRNSAMDPAYFVLEAAPGTAAELFAGTTIIMSTHMMRQIEELCDPIVLINKGRNVLYGPLDTIRRDYSGHAVTVRVAGELPATAVSTFAIRSLFMEVPSTQFFASAAISLLSGVIVVWLAGRAFRLSMLRYGQRLRLSELLSQLRWRLS